MLPSQSECYSATLIFDTETVTNIPKPKQAAVQSKLFHTVTEIHKATRYRQKSLSLELSESQQITG